MREAAGDVPRTRIAKWTVARGLRSLDAPRRGRGDPARARARDGAREAPDGYIYEELAEIALARGDPAAAAPLGARRRTRCSQDDAASSRRAGAARAAREMPAGVGRPIRDESGEAPRRSSSACATRIRTRSRELEYATPFELLVAVVLSAQATDKSVNKATATLFRSPTRPRRSRHSASTG